MTAAIHDGAKVVLDRVSAVPLCGGDGDQHSGALDREEVVAGLIKEAGGSAALYASSARVAIALALTSACLPWPFMSRRSSRATICPRILRVLLADGKNDEAMRTT
jgi:hypothetical protein